MHSSKQNEARIRDSYNNADLLSYIEAIRAKFNESPFDRYRFKLYDDILNKNRTLGATIDIGGNIGLLEKRYAERSSAIVLCDKDLFSLKGARVVNENLPTKIDYLCSDIYKLPFKNAYFDTVIAFEVLEHLPKEKHSNAIDELLRISKKGAKIYISTPNKISLAGLEGKIIEAFVRDYKWNAWDPTHQYIYSSFEFIDYLKHFDAEIVRSIGSYYLPGSLIVRMPRLVQNALGSLSYLISKHWGKAFPFKWCGFTVVAELRKR